MKDEKGKTLPWLIAAIILVGIPLVLAFIQACQRSLFSKCLGGMKAEVVATIMDFKHDWPLFLGLAILSGIIRVLSGYRSKKNKPDQQNADPGDALSDESEADVWDFGDDSDGGFGDSSDDGE